MLLASYARASGALCRNERLKLGARALGVSGASRAVACRPCVSGVGRESRRSCLWLARAVLRLLAVAVPAPRFPHGGFHLRERYADVWA